LSNVAGEIYFIAEEPSLTTPTVRVKIGLVRESDSRDSQDRLLDHQTGNPRSLVLIKAIKTARVSHVENSLHQRYAGRRGIGEWFELTKTELDSAIAECSQLAEQQSVHLPVIQQAEALKHVTRSGSVVPATEESIAWHRTYQVAKASESVFVDLKSQYKKLIESAHEAGLDVNRYAAISRSRMRLESWFLAHHKDAYDVCKRTSKSESFKVKNTNIGAALAIGHTELAEEFQAKIVEWRPGNDLDNLHQMFLETRRPSTTWKEEKDLANAHLKVLCGLDLGIEGICAWTPIVSKRFSSEIAKDQFPNLVQLHAELDMFGAPSVRLRGGEETGD
jgi:hypothetical protein